MIIRAVNVSLEKPQENYIGTYAPTSTDDHTLDFTKDAVYPVYALRKNGENTEYFLLPDSRPYFFWVPSGYFEIEEANHPSGWKTDFYTEGILQSSYPSLFDWETQEGIIGNNTDAVQLYMNEADNDKTFPQQNRIDELNSQEII